MNEGVLIERIENIKKTLEDNHRENKEAHEKIMTKQDFTNGKVRSIQIWKASIVATMSLLAALSFYAIRDYQDTKSILISHEKESSTTELRLERLEEEFNKIK